MARPDWIEADFDRLYAYVRGLEVVIPLLTLPTPMVAS
jgi:hypothetical protein